jgi:tetratricopeptide (TPR) repeat protein
VSQVERDVLPVDRLPVLRSLAAALGVSVQDLRPEAAGPPATVDGASTDDLGALRLAITGHPALGALLGAGPAVSRELPVLRAAVDEAWRLIAASQFRAVDALLVPLLAELEAAGREHGAARRPQVARLLTGVYEAAAAAFARLGDADAAWLAADRAVRWAEDAGDPLAAVASSFRIGHAFLTLERLDQAEHVAVMAIEALRPMVDAEDCPPEALSLYGALHLLLAVVHAGEADGTGTRQAIAAARKIAARLGADRNDYNTEFGPTNVVLHAVSTAVDLGNAGEALKLAETIDASCLSPERQSRLFINLARAHTQRRQAGEAVAALLAAERLAPEQVQASTRAREMVHDLLNLAGRRATLDLLSFARRIGASI